MKYFLGLSSAYSAADVLGHTFAVGNEYHLSELRAFLAAHYGATFDHVAVYSNGRTALNVAIKAVTKRGAKVIVTSLTCYAVVQAVKSAGCVPIFADVDENTLHFGAKELEKALEGETNVQAIIVQNNLGIPVDIAEIEAVAEAHKLSIIEDLAHCAGVKYPDGREVGTVGRVAALSFGKGKSIDAITGGAVVFTNPLDQPVKQPELPPKFKDNLCARLYPLLSAIIRGGYNLNQRLGQYLQSGFVKIHLIKRSADGVVDPKTRITFWQCKRALRQLQALPHRGRPPLRDFELVYNRNELLAELEKAGYYFRDIWYDLPVAPQRYFRKADFHPELCPVATRLAEQIINLPTWYDEKDLEHARKIIAPYLVNRPPEAESAETEEAEQADDAENSEAAEGKDGAAGSKVGKKSKQLAAKATAAAKKLASSFKNEKKPAFWKDRRANTEDGAPDEELAAEEKPDLKTRVAKAKDKISKKSKADDEDGDKDYYDPTISVLEQSSGLLDASGKKQSQSQPEVAAKSTTSSTAQQIATEVEKPKSTPKTTKNVKKSDRAPKTDVPAKTATSAKNTNSPKDGLSGMRVAPKKLSDREKLKQQLESGQKGKPSVL